MWTVWIYAFGHYPSDRTAIGRLNIAYKPSSETTRGCFCVYSASSSVQLEFWRRSWENQEVWSDSTPSNSAYVTRVFAAYISTLIWIGYQVFSRVNWSKYFFQYDIYLYTPINLYLVMLYFVWVWLDDEFERIHLIYLLALFRIASLALGETNHVHTFLSGVWSPLLLTHINFNPSRDK